MVDLRRLPGFVLVLMLVAGCTTPPRVQEKPVLVVYVGEGLLRWDEPLHFEIKAGDSYAVIYRLEDSEAAGSSNQRQKTIIVRLDEPRKAELTPFDGTGQYTALVGVLRQQEIVLVSRPLSVFLETPAPSQIPQSRRIEVQLQGPRIVYTPHGSFPLGFMVIWSKNPDPVFPTRPRDLAIYRGPTDPKEVRLQPFDGPGEYHVRVFEFLGEERTGLVSETLKVRLP